MTLRNNAVIHLDADAASRYIHVELDALAFDSFVESVGEIMTDLGWESMRREATDDDDNDDFGVLHRVDHLAPTLEQVQRLAQEGCVELGARVRYTWSASYPAHPSTNPHPVVVSRAA